MGYSSLDIISGYVRLGRPINSTMGVIALFLGVSIVSGELPTLIPLDRAIAIALLGFLVTYSIMAINDIVDIESDKVNTPWRPLASGLIPVASAWRVSILAILSALGLSFYVEPSPLTTITALWFLALAHFYNFLGKRFLLMGNIIVSFLTAFPLLYGSILASVYIGPLWDLGDYMRAAIFWAMVFFATLGREIAKGIVDVEGDTKVGVRTVANTYGVRTAGFIALVMYTVSIALSLTPIMLGVVNTIQYAIVIAPVGLLAFIEGLSLAGNPSEERALVHKKRILLLMLISMLGLYMGSRGA